MGRRAIFALRPISTKSIVIAMFAIGALGFVLVKLLIQRR
jgi:hypothetical protein